tara:strand:- start:179 stop:340 length:162 start_codon:yes stop_codon:yes gene_type:complete
MLVVVAVMQLVLVIQVDNQVVQVAEATELVALVSIITKVVELQVKATLVVVVV